MLINKVENKVWGTPYLSSFERSGFQLPEHCLAPGNEWFLLIHKNPLDPNSQGGFALPHSMRAEPSPLKLPRSKNAPGH